MRYSLRQHEVLPCPSAGDPPQTDLGGIGLDDALSNG